MKRVLLVGGSKHGQWIEVPDPDYVIRVAKPMNPLSVWNPDPELDVSILDMSEDYWVEKIPIEMQELRCLIQAGIWTGLHGIDKTRATVHAIFQRDIAEMFSSKDWAQWS